MTYELFNALRGLVDGLTAGNETMPEASQRKTDREDAFKLATLAALGADQSFWLAERPVEYRTAGIHRPIANTTPATSGPTAGTNAAAKATTTQPAASG